MLRLFILGKPGCGKTAIATRLASDTNTILIEPSSILTDIVHDKSNSNAYKEAKLFQSIASEKLTSPEAKYRGYVYECNPSTNDYFEKLSSHLSTDTSKPPPILIELTIDDVDLCHRRCGFYVDPITGLIYPDTQVQVSIEKLKTKNQENLFDEASSDEDSTGEDKGDNERQSEEIARDSDNETAENAADETTSIQKSRKKVDPTNELKRKIKWDIISPEILERLVQRPEDLPATVKHLLERYKSFEENVKTFRQLFAAPFRIQVDCTQPFDDVYGDLMDQLEMLCLSARTAGLPKWIKAEINPGLSTDEILSMLQEYQLEEGMPPRQMSKFGLCCPVGLHKSRTVVQGSRHLYFLSSESSLHEFIREPTVYLTQSHDLSALTLCILGPPKSGKSTLAKAIADIYGLEYINVSGVIQSEIWGDSPESSSLVKAIAKKLKNGKVIPADMLMEYVKPRFQAAADKNRGWVLDGFPQQGEQAARLAEARLLPKYAIMLQCDKDLIKQRYPSKYTELSPGNLPSNQTFSTSDTYMPPLDIPGDLFYTTAITACAEEQIEVVKHLEEIDCTITTLDISKSTLEIATSLIQGVIDPLFPKAVPFNAKSSGQAFTEFGVTKNYCPVTLKQKKSLRKGDPQIGATYLSKVYYLANEDARARFISEPTVFAIEDPEIPPPRLFIIGPSGSGKTTFIAQLLKKHESIHVNCVSLLKDLRHEKPELLDDIDIDQPLPAEIVREIMNILFNTEPYASKGFFLEGFPRSKTEADTILKLGYYADAVIAMRTDNENIMKRLIAAALNDDPYLASYNADSEEEENPIKTLKDDIVVNAEREIASLEGAIIAMDESRLIEVIEIDANKCPRAAYANALTRLKPILEFAIPTETSTANGMLKEGLMSYSKFGKHCPVSFARTGYLSTSHYGKKPVVFGDYIYWLFGEDEEKDFLLNPIKYASLPIPNSYAVPSIAIIGGPRSGKTTVSRALANEFNAVYLTPEIVIQAIIETDEDSRLKDQIKSLLYSGKEVPSNVFVQAVKYIISRGPCKNRGYILDGFPTTKEQAEELESVGIVPQFVACLDVEFEVAVQRKDTNTETGKETVFGNSSIHELTSKRLPSFFQNEFDRFKSDIQALRTFYGNNYCCWIQMESGLSKWRIRALLKEKIQNGVMRLQNYLDAIVRGVPAPILDVGLPLPRIKRMDCPMGKYCPVSFVDRDELIQSPLTNEFAVEYKNKLYRLAGALEMQAFIATPERYSNIRLPSVLAVHLSPEDVKSLFPKQLEFLGYCPVTMYEGNASDQSLVEGHPNFVVDYDGKLYAMFDQVKMEQFMRSPWRFTNYVPPRKLPPRVAPVELNSLPPSGYLERTLSAALNAAMLSVGKVRPKLPFESLQSSALRYIALYLKAHNPASKDFVKRDYHKKLQHFKEKCCLVHFLSSNAHLGPESKNKEFDDRMNHFFSKKGNGIIVLPPIRKVNRTEDDENVLQTQKLNNSREFKVAM
ncbi:hypothetical protein BKA69DRAFT_1124009 [Paraphysoderma sedebokerense]|nr:hypothetical protein BKA69DRAFT_1124009 [Paraphysoderma sedebokerense]